MNQQIKKLTPSEKLEEQFAVVFTEVPKEYDRDKGQEVIINDPTTR